MDSTHLPQSAAPAPHSDTARHTPSGGRARDTLRDAELVISYVLRGGVVVSGAIILAGVIAYYVRYGSAAARVRADRDFPHSVPDVFGGLAHGDPLAIVTLGLLVLLITPVMRVLVSVLAFAIERDWRYVGITALVFVILIISFLLGKAGA